MSVKEVGKATAEFSTEVEKIIWKLTSYAKKVVTELREKKANLNAEIECGLEEVEMTISLNLAVCKVPLFGELAQTLGTMQLFTYTQE